MRSRTDKKAPFRAGSLVLPLIGLLAMSVAAIRMPRPSLSQTQTRQNPPQQQSQDQFKIGVEVNLVTVPVTVRKTGGGFIKGLPKNAFRIQEDGEEQEILTFAQENVPTRIAIVLDASGSVRGEWGTIKHSTRRFLENLHPEDQFALVAFNTETFLKMDWGRDTGRLDAVLTSIYCKDNTNLWDTIWVVANEVFKEIREKKAMIIMSDGLDNNSAMPYMEALSAAVHSEAAVYVVSKTQAVRQAMIDAYADAGYYSGIPEEAFSQADMALRKLAYETGGRVLYPNNFGQLGDVYSEVQEELRNQYTLGYISTNTSKDGTYRRIEVGVKAPDASVSARPGYYAPNRLPSSKK